MKLSDSLSDRVGHARGSAVCVGTFDGVHLGHRSLLSATKKAASERSLASVAITFRQQPRSVINPDHAARYLCPLEERLELLNSVGLDLVAPVDFDDSVRLLTASDFIRTLMDTVGLRVLVIGPGARQGHDRLGNAELVAMGREVGFEVVEATPEKVGDQFVSSSAIRKQVESGQVEKAAALLGRDFSLSGPVVQGEHRGRTLGYPTANVAVAPDCVLPMDGIYATRAQLDDGTKRLAATSIGVRPTFGAGARTVEAYLLDFDGSIYGQRLTLQFARRLRGEVSFDGVPELTEQIRKDVEETRALLGAIP